MNLMAAERMHTHRPARVRYQLCAPQEPSPHAFSDQPASLLEFIPNIGFLPVQFRFNKACDCECGMNG
jgi:hypothetical protein